MSSLISGKCATSDAVFRGLSRPQYPEITRYFPRAPAGRVRFWIHDIKERLPQPTSEAAPILHEKQRSHQRDIHQPAIASMAIINGEKTTEMSEI
jgi:hypothetical protein